MNACFTTAERKMIEEGIRSKYAKAACGPEGLFNYPTGREGLAALNYDDKFVRSLPDTVADSYCGVGNPFSLGPIHQGDAVLDIGCGAGVDTMAAASMKGGTGRVVGVDLSPEMIDRAKSNLAETDLENVTFQRAGAESLPFSDESFDVVISNGVFNLVPDKAKASAEVFRVLKPGGRLMMADQFLVGEQPGDIRAKIGRWADWEGGAVPGRSFLEILEQAGAVDVELGDETGFNSSPVTRSILLRALKPSCYETTKKTGAPVAVLDKYREFFDAAYADGHLDVKTKRLIALGASLAAGCDSWTRYCLAVARKLGATDDELSETMTVAMTVVGTKIRILHDSSLDALLDETEEEGPAASEATRPTDQAECETWST